MDHIEETITMDVALRATANLLGREGLDDSNASMYLYTLFRVITQSTLDRGNFFDLVAVKTLQEEAIDRKGFDAKVVLGQAEAMRKLSLFIDRCAHITEQSITDRRQIEE